VDSLRPRDAGDLIQHRLVRDRHRWLNFGLKRPHRVTEPPRALLRWRSRGRRRAARKTLIKKNS